MNIKQNILISFVIVMIFCLWLLIIFGDKGLADLNSMKREKQSLIQKNKKITQENRVLKHSINRLTTDPIFIENIARRELGMIRRNEVIYLYLGARPTRKYPEIRIPSFAEKKRPDKIGAEKEEEQFDETEAGESFSPFYKGG